MDLNRLYQYLKDSPRDTRWMMRKLGPDFRVRLDELRAQGRPVLEDFAEVEGMKRLLYRADDQVEIAFANPKRNSRRG